MGKPNWKNEINMEGIFQSAPRQHQPNPKYNIFYIILLICIPVCFKKLELGLVYLDVALQAILKANTVSKTSFKI